MKYLYLTLFALLSAVLLFSQKTNASIVWTGASTLNGDTSATSFTFSASTTGDNAMFVLGVRSSGGDYVTSATFGGVDMVFDRKCAPAVWNDLYMYHFAATTTSLTTTNVKVNLSSAASIYPRTSSFNGVQTSPFPSNTICNQDNSSIFTITATTTADNGWGFVLAINNAANLNNESGTRIRTGSYLSNVGATYGPLASAGDLTTSLGGAGGNSQLLMTFEEYTSGGGGEVSPAPNNDIIIFE